MAYLISLRPIFGKLPPGENAKLHTDIHNQSAYNFSNLCVYECLSYQKGHLSAKCALGIHINQYFQDNNINFSKEPP